jgi:membrane fusion protein, multidrug efflux system
MTRFASRPRLLVVFLVNLFGCGAQATAAKSREEEVPITVKTQVVSAEEVALSIVTAGNIKSHTQAEVASNISGRILQVLFDRGTTVLQGEPMLRVDVQSAALSYAEADSAHRSAKTQQEIAKVECTRADALKARGALTAQEHERVLAQCRSAADAVDVAKARVASVAKTVSDGWVRAPFAGRVTERFVHVGEYAHEDSKIATLVSQDTNKLEFYLAERYLPTLQEGAKVSFEVAAYPGVSFGATVRSLGSAVREASRDVVVDAVITPDPPVHTEPPQSRDAAATPVSMASLRTGMFAKVRVPVGTQRLPTVATTALRQLPGETHLFVVREGHVEERVVAVQAHRPDIVAILRGLEVGETVVMVPSENLQNGQAVRQ